MQDWFKASHLLAIIFFVTSLHTANVANAQSCESCFNPQQPGFQFETPGMYDQAPAQFVGAESSFGDMPAISDSAIGSGVRGSRALERGRIGSRLSAENRGVSGRRTLSLFGGGNWLIGSQANDFVLGNNTEFDNGYIVGLALGRKMDYRSRIEFETSFQSLNVPEFVPGPLVLPPIRAEGDVNVTTGIINFYLDLPNVRRMHPYVGAGIGYAFLDGDVNVAGLFPLEFKDNSALAFQAIGGVTIPVSDRAEMFIEYRYYQTEDFIVTSTFASADIAGPVKTHNLIGGLRFTF